MDADPALRRRIGRTVVGPDSAEYKDLQVLSSACNNEITNAMTFVVMEDRKQTSKLSDATKDCLKAGFAALEKAKIDQILAEGVEVPSGPVVDLEKRCGL